MSDGPAMDLADELAADFDYEPEVEEPQANGHGGRPFELRTMAEMEEDLEADDVKPSRESLEVPEGGVRPQDELDEEEVARLNTSSLPRVSKVAKLADSDEFQEALEKIGHYRRLPPSDMSTSDSAEYKLIVQVNNYAVEIDNEMLLVHKFVRDHYAPRFSELESLGIANPIDYCRAVRAIGNPAVFGKEVAASVQGILPNATIMIVTVTASENKGRQLTAEEWDAVSEACDMMLTLDAAKRTILDYVESRIALLAPNLSSIIGSRTATKLLGIAGGLHALSRTPAGNLHLFGAQKRAALGLSSGSYSAQRRHVGFIFSSELVQSIPEEYRGRAQRTVAAKCALAVRADLSESHKDGSFGNQLYLDCVRRLEKLVEPPPSKLVKALPVPTEGPKKRRGGQRARKAKEAYATSELQKLRNRMAFGKEEEETGAYDETMGMGMIGASSGRIRANAGELRTKAKMSKSNKARLDKFRSQSSGTATSGLSSAIAFTPVQGLELADPWAAKRAAQANESWFKNENSGSFSVLPGAGVQSKLIQD